VPHLFFDITSSVEYNIDKLKSLGTIAAFGYVKQFFQLLQRKFTLNKCYNYTSSSSLIIAPLLTRISINLELGESVKVAVELLIDVI